jgi:hypothetical protein
MFRDAILSTDVRKTASLDSVGSTYDFPTGEPLNDNELAVLDRYLELAREVKHANHLARKEADKMNQGGWDWFRHASFKTVSWKWFETCILSVIFLNIITLALYEPSKPANADRNQILQQIEAVFLLIYWLELIVKILSDGIWQEKCVTRPPYLRVSENILDLIIVISGTVEFVVWINSHGDGSSDASFGLAALRALRALRVMKFMKGVPSLRLVVGVILHSLPQIGTVGIIGMVSPIKEYPIYISRHTMCRTRHLL